jgi:hypothetical protein
MLHQGHDLQGNRRIAWQACRVASLADAQAGVEIQNRIQCWAVEVIAEDANAFRLPPAKYASRTAMFFGDPPIGRSALDQRQAQQ